MNQIIFDSSIGFYFILILRLLLACILGGIIGYEREQTHRPAGFRTHMLVCVGSALVMITSEFIFKRYSGLANMDPSRLGAQVISGIGFLGAGTIIREGFSVKGLTTAASLWAVSCVGIAAGIGFYEGAAAATILVYLILIVLKRIDGFMALRNEHKAFYVLLRSEPGQIQALSSIFDKYKANIKKIEFLNSEGDKSYTVKINMKLKEDGDKVRIFEDFQNISGIQKVYEE